jgi:hypothetical protein
MNLNKAVQIAVELMHLHQQNISNNHPLDDPSNQAFIYFYDRYTEAIELLNGLVIIPASLGTNSLSQAPDPDTTPAVQGANLVIIPASLGTKPDQYLVHPVSSHQSDVDRDIERRR